MGLRGLGRVLGMADELSLFNNTQGYGIAVSADYYTHAEVRRGRIVAP